MYVIKGAGWLWPFKTILTSWKRKTLCQNIADFSIDLILRLYWLEKSYLRF